MPPSEPKPHPEPDPAAPTTHTWLARWREGDAHAFEVLEARYRRLLEARIRRAPSWESLSRHCTIDDVLQEFWAEAIDAMRNRFIDAGTGSLLGYLLTIADRTVVDLARSRSAKKRGSDRERSLPAGFDTATPKVGCAPQESPTGRARTNELRQLARRVLNARELEVWELVEWEGFSAEEVALALHESSEAIRSVKHRAKAKLITSLQADQ